MTDKELIRKVHAGNKGALNAIIDKYYDDIYRFCFYLTLNELDSYDISQEVFLRFIKYIDTYTYKNLKGYLLIIARNLCRDYLRIKELENTVEISEDAIYADKEIRNIEFKLYIDAILNRIPFEQREVVVLRIQGNLRFKDIAKMLGCNLSTVKSRYRSGIEKMRKEMADYEE